MCVIAYFPKNSKEPSRNDLVYMWNSNPNGAGMMWIENDGVHYSKGYFDFDEFYKDFLIIKRDWNFECAVHFRIATSGGINQEMCHPFPLTSNTDKLKKLYGKANCVIMHNGILNIPTPHNDLNDTCEFIINKLVPAYSKDKSFFLHFTPAKRKIFESSDLNGSNKMLFFSLKGVEMFGNWQKYNDYYVSNTHWVWRKEKWENKWKYRSYYDYGNDF